MKIAILNDLHFGARNGNIIFEEELLKFLDEIFFPYMDINEVNHLIVAGDIFDDRKSIRVKTMNVIQESFLDPLTDREIKCWFTLGNHDIVYRNTLTPNSLEPILSHYRQHGFTLVDAPKVIDFDGCSLMLMPWICSENRELAEIMLANGEGLRADILISHMDIAGSQVVPGVVLENGETPSSLSNFERVLNGHIHTRSEFANVINLGTQYQFNWSDWDQRKGFHVLDTTNKKLEFVPNPADLYLKIYYDGDYIEGRDALEWVKERAPAYSNKFVKVVLSGRQDRYKFEQFTQIIEDVGCHEVTYIEDLSLSYDGEEVFDIDSFDRSKSTIQLISDFIDESDVPSDMTENLKKLFVRLHTEAINTGVMKE